MRETIYYEGVDFDVEYHIEKGESATYDNDGSADKVIIEEVWIDHIELMPFLDAKVMEFLIDKIEEKL